MSKSIVYLFCLLWCAQLSVNGQNAMRSIGGKVVDQQMHPLALINIQIKGTATGTASDSRGKFILPLVSEKSIVLIFSAVGYQRTERRVLFSEIKSSLVQVMKAESTTIQEVTIEKKRQNNNLQNIQPKLTS